MSYIDLDRRFLRWDEKDSDASEAYALLRHYSHDDLDWPKLLQHRRVVLLAEAGSGKSEELREQARRLAANNQFAFYATVQDVARQGLEGAIGHACLGRLEQWRASEQPGWFFIDSIDEAKLDRIHLETALRKLADGFSAAPRRAYLVLSGRLTDWEFRADLNRLAACLPVPPEPSALPAPTPDTLLVQTLRGERRKKLDDKLSVPLVVLMAPLNAERVRRFAAGKGVTALDPFMAAIEDANLWSLASRPRDLEWLVAYWRRHNRFGPLAEVLATSVSERLRETNEFHARSDPISDDRALLALERVGAAFVFGRRDRLSIPDSDIDFAASVDFDLAHVLPDWSADHRGRLLMRPVFDPGTFGRVRLHNDNLGEVRSYLAARWLKRRREQNASLRELLDLLFANSYGVPLIKPSLRQTAAWLAIWDGDVAREVLAREPMLLLTEGDPGSLSLAVRIGALRDAVAGVMATGQYPFQFAQDALRRFSTPDLVPEIRAQWTAHKGHRQVRELLLRMIALGRLQVCADIAAEGLFGSYSDRVTLVFAGRALAATGDAAALGRYAEKIKASASNLPGRVLWDALDHLFPVVLSIQDLLELVRGMSESVRDESLGLQIQGPQLARRLSSRADLEVLLAGLLDQLGPGVQSTGSEETSAEKAYFPILTDLASSLLKLTDANEAPPLAIDVALRIGEHQRYRPPSDEAKELITELRKSRERRRAALWRAVVRFEGHPLIRAQGLQRPMQLAILGWDPGLVPGDAEWLLVDLGARAPESERRFALGALMELWANNERDPRLLNCIQAATRDAPALATVVDSWVTPREATAEELESHAELARLQREGEAGRLERDRSWQQLLDRLRADPGILGRQPPPTPGRVDANLFYLWELLHNADERRNHFAIDDLSAIEPILGAELSAAFRDALMRFWRQWPPTLPSTRPPEQRNVVSNIDLLALCGVSVEAKETASWPAGLSSADATKAAAYALVEINGFPTWLDRLAAAFPSEVETVLMTEIRSEIATVVSGPHHGTLEDVVHGSQTMARCVAQPLLDLLIARVDFPSTALSSTLSVIGRGLSANRDKFAAMALARFDGASDLSVAPLYFAAAFRVTPEAAIAALLARLDALPPDAQTSLVQHALRELFGDRISGLEATVPEFPFGVLERLMEVAFRTIRVEDDNRRDDGEVFSPDARDAAENARNALFNRLSQTPGRATFEYLHRLGRQRGFPIPPQRLQELAFARAASDAEHSPWASGEAYAMEGEFDSAPNSPLDLQRLALRRVSDMQHALHHADFAQGREVKKLRPETAVQIWVADRLQLKQGRAYSVEREPEVVEGKMPDIRLRARHTDASLPVEIKVAESWTLSDLEDALVKQLGGRYLRAQDANHGVLLVVHQLPRVRGWRSARGHMLNFEQVITHLQKIADRRAAIAPDSPQARIAVLDVSEIQTDPPDNRRPSTRSRGRKGAGKIGRKGPPKTSATRKARKAKRSRSSSKPK